MSADRAAALVCMLLAGLALAGVARAANQRIALGPGEQQVLAFPGTLATISVSDPEVASVAASGKRDVLVTGKASGTTTVRVWLQGEDQPRVTQFQVSDLSGDRNPTPMQVQTDIRIVEVNRSELNSLGVYYARLFNGGENSITIAPPGAGARGFGSARSAAAPISTEGFNLFSFGSSSLSIINALESGGFAYTLAEPSLVSLSGQTATFLSGGEFPIPVSSNNGDIQIEFKQFGVSLALTPTVVDEDQIVLKVAPEVSELDFSSGVTTGGVSVPGLRVRKTETMVSMASGQSFIISGLVSRATSNNSDRIPGLGDIPILGAFFRSDRVSSENKELIMVVTPHLVSPMDELPLEARNFGKAYGESSTGFLDMMGNSNRPYEPIENGLSW